MATLTLRTQTTGIRPQFDHEVGSRRRATQTTKGSPIWRGRQINERALKTFGLEWPNTGAGQKAQLLKAWNDAHGNVAAMNYTPIGDVDANAIEVRFVDGTLETEQLNAKRWRLRAEIEQVR